MADFKTHISVSSALGVAYGGAAYAMFDVPAPTCVLAAGLCGVAGMLPDVDSGPGRPLREISLFLAAVVPTMLFERLQRLGTPPETIILIGAAVYFTIRFGLARFLKHVCVHRGMFHSIPAALIFGELAFLLASGDDTALRWYKAGAVVLGYVCHLVLDEIYAVQWDGVPRPKKSFGSGLKIVGRGWWPNLSAYGKLAVLTLVVIEEPGLMRDWHDGRMQELVQKIRSELPERLADTNRQLPVAAIPSPAPNAEDQQPPTVTPQEVAPVIPYVPDYYTGQTVPLVPIPSEAVQR